MSQWLRSAIRCWSASHIAQFLWAVTYKFSEVAFVGKAPGTYLMLLGGGYYGQRLNKIYRGSANLLCTTHFL